MPTVRVKEEYAAILEPLQESVDEALRRYALEKVQTRIGTASTVAEGYDHRFGHSALTRTQMNADSR